MAPDSQPNTTEIGRLIDRIQAGQPGARQELIEKCYQRFVLIARRMLNSPEFRDLRRRGVDSADVVHETLLERIFKENKSGKDLLARREFDDPTGVIRMVASHIRFCLKDIVFGRNDAALRQAGFKSNAPSDGGQQAHDKMRAPFPESGKEEELAFLVEALDELDEKDRQVIECRYLVGLSREETAATLGVSTKYVTRHARQGLEQLGKRLGKPVNSLWN